MKTRKSCIPQVLVLLAACAILEVVFRTPDLTHFTSNDSQRTLKGAVATTTSNSNKPTFVLHVGLHKTGKLNGFNGNHFDR
jgi:hypothetical protein